MQAVKEVILSTKRHVNPAANSKESVLKQLLFAREIASEGPQSLVSYADFLKRLSNKKTFGRSSRRTREHQMLDLFKKVNTMEEMITRSQQLNIEYKKSTEVMVTVDALGTVHDVKITDFDPNNVDFELLAKQIVEAHENAQRKLFEYKSDEWNKRLIQEYRQQNPTLTKLLREDPIEALYRDHELRYRYPKEIRDEQTLKKVLDGIDELNQKEKQIDEALRAKYNISEQEDQQLLDTKSASEVQAESDFEVMRGILSPLPYDIFFIRSIDKTIKEYDEAHGEGSFRRDIADKERFYKLIEEDPTAVKFLKDQNVTNIADILPKESVLTSSSSSSSESSEEGEEESSESSESSESEKSGEEENEEK